MPVSGCLNVSRNERFYTCCYLAKALVKIRHQDAVHLYARYAYLQSAKTFAGTSSLPGCQVSKPRAVMR